jgi:hypothetical protein
MLLILLPHVVQQASKCKSEPDYVLAVPHQSSAWVQAKLLGVLPSVCLSQSASPTPSTSSPSALPSRTPNIVDISLPLLALPLLLAA